MSDDGDLKEYRRKRRFEKTPEPAGEQRSSQSGRLYLIQKHAARALHYDLRLELDGVLKSWAVPKGPSRDPGEKRLAVQVEDHPVAYGSFEGIIPAGEYGGGTVMLWDQGEWEPDGDPVRGLQRGRLSFRIRGQKLHGNWTLARMGGKRGEGGRNWLLIKRTDEEALPDEDRLAEEDRSVLSGRTMAEIASAADTVWRNGESVPAEVSQRGEAEGGDRLVDPAALPGARQAPQPEKIRPLLATLVKDIPEGEGWLHEIKYDGYRMTCTLSGGRARLFTRNGHDWTDRFAAVAEAAAKLEVGQAILDGEIVVVDKEGKTDFQALQNVLRGERSGYLVYYLFDVVHYQGYDLSRVPLEERKKVLQHTLARCDPESSLLRYSDHIRGKGKNVWQHACRYALEGVISKAANSPYVPKRSPHWLKIKCIQRQEFVIGGYTEPGGSRGGFGALLVGVQDEAGHLVYAGKVGTGYSEATLETLSRELQKRQRQTSPFSPPPTGAEARKAHWVRPELLAEVEFTEWTGDGRLRHPSFKGLREDRDAKGIGREAPAELGTVAEEVSSARRTDTPRAPSSQEGNRVGGVVLSNPERILYPEQGISKLELARFYEEISDWILPHLRHRPLTLVRCPRGRGHKCFYQKHLTDTLPDPLRGISVQEKEGKGLYIVLDDLAGLISLVQLGVLEIHPWGSREDRLERPDRVTFDFDPGPEVEWEDLLHGARRLRDRLESLGLKSFVKTTGGKGLHVVVPLLRRSSWEEVKSFASAVAVEMAREDPQRYVATMSKAKRHGRIFIDYLRNARGATSVAAYSTRARPGAPVSTPLRWDELSADLAPDHYTISNLRQRLSRLQSDPWQGFFDLRQSLTKAIRQELGY